MSNLIAGIDEAGRGALIGPLIIVGLAFKPKDLKYLKEIGVKDSKKVSKNRREELFENILNVAKKRVLIKVPAKLIDKLREKDQKLDEIEILRIARIVEKLNCKKVYIDALTSNPKRFEERIKRIVKKRYKIVAENFADQKYICVSAASIVAKVERDRDIERIKREANFDFGVGYAHDPKTIEFIEKILKEDNKLKKFVRESWITIQNIKQRMAQRSLKEWLKI